MQQARGHAPMHLISMGITPGLSCVGLCALSFPMLDGRVILGKGRVIEHDVLIGTRPTQMRKLGIPEPGLLSTAHELAKRFKVHRLLLEVLLERHNPAIIAIGPPAKLREPDTFAKAAALGVTSIGAVFEIPVIQVSKSEISAHFGAPFAEAVQERLVEPIESTDRRVLLAAAAAVVSVERLLQLFAPQAPPTLRSA